MPVFSFPCFLSLSFDLELAITNNKVEGRRMFWDQTAGIYDLFGNWYNGSVNRRFLIPVLFSFCHLDGSCLIVKSKGKNMKERAHEGTAEGM